MQQQHNATAIEQTTLTDNIAEMCDAAQTMYSAYMETTIPAWKKSLRNEYNRIAAHVNKLRGSKLLILL